MTQQQLAMNACGWCGEAPWTYSCTMCDPRRTKRVCDDCAKRWHSRGFSQQHVLSNRAGESSEFCVWFRNSLDQPPAQATQPNGSTEPQQQRSNGRDDTHRASLSGTSLEIIEQQIDMEHSGEETAERKQRSLLAEADEVLITQSSSGIGEIHSGGKGDESTADDEDTEEEVVLQAHEEKLMPLNELLAQFSSEEPRLVDMLAEYINAAMRIQDGIACTRYRMCTQQPCTSVVAHFRHNTNGDVPCDAECRLGLEIFQHMKTCSQPDCLFCIRVWLRKALNNIRAIEFLVIQQKKAMKQLLQDHKNGASDAQAKFNFCSTQVKDYERKRVQLIEGVEEMNTTVLNLRLPIFNFPQPVWHITNEPIIKTEQIEPNFDSESVDKQSTVAKKDPLPQSTFELESSSDEVGVDQANDVSSATSSSDFTGLGADYIRVLLSKKKSDPLAQRKFDESIDLAYAIVEASFCSTSKAPRCLLQCQKILDHLQHHLDLNVCEDIMCTTVEFHFAHLSMCSEEQESDTCEYCLRVKEREFMRALDMMEGEQREAEAKAQAVINEMATSLANDPHKEHEAAMEQLNDELEQAEDYKHDMAKKLSSARMNLREVRERMEKLPDPVATSVLKMLPLHFIKVMRKDPNAQSKKRRE